MTYHDIIIMLIIGSIFLVLGFLGLLWGKKEEGAYYGSISEHKDVREFFEKLPGRPEPGALRTGGKICLVLAVVLFLICLGIYLWGMSPKP
jgi:hypothetical protein